MKTLNINEVAVTDKPVIFTCHGLGSCIGLFITDRLKKISGGAHIPMPSSSAVNQYRDVKQMMDELLDGFHELGSNLKYLRAKITGGAKVYDCSFDIGRENTIAVFECLVEKKIFIAASDVGGQVARTAWFNVATGELKISTSDKKMYSI